MNRKKIRSEQLSLEKLITRYGIRADKLDATVRSREAFLETIEDEKERTKETTEIARLKLQLIKVNAEYDSFVTRHKELSSIANKNRNTIAHADDDNRPVRSHQDIQPTGL